VHADAASSASARAVKADAYTVGNDIVFGLGQYAPSTSEGRLLLAHELAHTVQQTNGSFRAAAGLTIAKSDQPAERDANLAARGVLLIRPHIPDLKESPVSLARQSASVAAPDDDRPPSIDRDIEMPILHQMDAPAVRELEGPQVLHPGDVYKTGGKTYVIYANEVRTGGVWAWINNNPGNIAASKEAEKYGAFPGKSNGNFAIFPDDATGYAAIISFIQARSDRTILGIMSIYAPRDNGVNPMLKGNNPDAYADAIARGINDETAGAPSDGSSQVPRVTKLTKISDLSDSALHKFADAIRRVETGPSGAGTAITTSDPALPQAIRDHLEKNRSGGSR
jgi:hypothetical protein